MAAGMRQTGLQFRQMVDGQIGDLRRLEQEEAAADAKRRNIQANTKRQLELIKNEEKVQHALIKERVKAIAELEKAQKTLISSAVSPSDDFRKNRQALRDVAQEAANLRAERRSIESLLRAEARDPSGVGRRSDIERSAASINKQRKKPSNTVIRELDDLLLKELRAQRAGRSSEIVSEIDTAIASRARSLSREVLRRSAAGEVNVVNQVISDFFTSVFQGKIADLDDKLKSQAAAGTVLRGVMKPEAEQLKASEAEIRRGQEAIEAARLAKQATAEGFKELEARKDVARRANEIATEQHEAAKQRTRMEREAVEARRDEANSIKQTATLIKQHLWGSLFDLQTKLLYLAGTVRSLGLMIESAAKFHYEATGLTTMLSKGRGAGEDVYGRYARMAGNQTEVMPSDAVRRMTELAAAGYSETEIPAGVAAIQNVLLAARGEVSQEGAADLGISLHRAFGTQGRDMTMLLDTVIAASNAFPMTVGKVRDAMGYATEAAVQLNQDVEEALIAIGALMPITKTASKAGTVYRGGGLSMVKPKGQEMLAQLGVMPTDALGKVRPLMDIFIDLDRELQKVQAADLAGSWQSPLQAREGKLRGELEESRAAREQRSILNKLQSAGLDTTQVQNLQARLREAEIKGELRAIRDAKAELKSELNLKRQELEFVLTGQRGGSWFAAVQKLPELAAAALRGTAYETGPGQTPYVFRNSADALAALRLSMEDTSGEARRMADELRKTSFMLGTSFDASVEKFKISLGTFLLPIRDSFLNVLSGVMNWFTSWVNSDASPKEAYGQLGGRPAGSSVGWNFAGTAMMLGGVTIAGMALKNIFGLVRNMGTLFDPTRIAKVASALQAGGDITEALQNARPRGKLQTFLGNVGDAALGGITRRTGDELTKLKAGIGEIAGKFFGFVPIIGLAVGGLMAFQEAVTTARKAISDFTAETDAAAAQRNEKAFRGVELALRLFSEGKLSFGDKGQILYPESERRAVLASGTYGPSAMRELLLGKSPAAVVEGLLNYRMGEIQRQYAGAPSEKQREIFTGFAMERQRLMGDTLLPLIGNAIEYMASSKGAGGRPSVDIRRLLATHTASRLTGDVLLPKYGEERGPGPVFSLLGNAIRGSGKNTFREAYNSMGPLDKYSLEMQLKNALSEEYDLNRGQLPSMKSLGLKESVYQQLRGFSSIPTDFAGGDFIATRLALSLDELGVTGKNWDKSGFFTPPGGSAPEFAPGTPQNLQAMILATNQAKEALEAQKNRDAETAAKQVGAADKNMKAAGTLNTAADSISKAFDNLRLSLETLTPTQVMPGAP
jgi:hypothetical protein